MDSLTLYDVAKRMDPKGQVAKIAELLTQTNEILLDMPFIEGNLPTGHKTTVRTGLPEVAWRELYGGVPQGKSTTKQVIDTCGMLEAYSLVDKKLAELNGNKASFMLSESRPFLEAMNQEMAKVLFYGKSSEKSKIVGLTSRFSTLSGADNSENVINAGGSSALASIWLVCLGEETVHGFYPKGSRVGLHQDPTVELKESVTMDDGRTGHYQALSTHYIWETGLCVRDWRYVVRICNIGTSTLTKNKSSGADLVDLLDQAVEKLPNLQLGKPVIYMNRTLRSFLRRQIKNTSNVHLTLEDIGGRKVVAYDGIPVRMCDQLTNNEDLVS